MGISDFDLDIIAATLTNITDWESTDLKKDFLECLEDNDILLPKSFAIKLIDDYLKVEARERASLNFNYKSFIKDRCIS